MPTYEKNFEKNLISWHEGVIQGQPGSTNQNHFQFFKSELMNKSQFASRIPQLKETISTQHTKIYITDKNIILSGANLESAYFTNRQGTRIKTISLVIVIIKGKAASRPSYRVATRPLLQY